MLLSTGGGSSLVMRYKEVGSRVEILDIEDDMLRVVGNVLRSYPRRFGMSFK